MVGSNHIMTKKHRRLTWPYRLVAALCFAPLASLLAACGPHCPAQEPDTRPIRLFSQRLVSKASKPTWHVGEDCRRTDKAPPNTTTITEEGTNWVCNYPPP